MQKVVSIPNSLYNSVKGRYFIGQTELLTFGGNEMAWGGLVNPYDSDRLLFVNVVTISNFTDEPFTAQIWYNSSVPRGSYLSTLVTPTNNALNRTIRNKIEIRYVSDSSQIRMNGRNVFDRVVPPNSTEVKEDDGKSIFSAGGTYSVLLVGHSESILTARIAFGWVEDKIFS